jgi:hypothetical protein
MQVITTKYISPTNTKGSRIKATASIGSSVTVKYNYYHDSNYNHELAVRALCKKLNWHGTLYRGETIQGSVWVFADPSKRVRV